MWRFEQVRLEEYLALRPRKGHEEIRRVRAENGTAIAESADDAALSRHRPEREPLDAGHLVGSLEISRSLEPLLLRTILVMLLMAPLGAAVFWVLRVLPLRALRQSDAALAERTGPAVYLP